MQRPFLLLVTQSRGRKASSQSSAIRNLIGRVTLKVIQWVRAGHQDTTVNPVCAELYRVIETMRGFDPSEGQR